MRNHIPPVGFIADAQSLTITQIREKYGIGQMTALRWYTNAGLTPLRRAPKPRVPKEPVSSATYACGHPRTPENTVGLRKKCCRQCQHDYKARAKAAEKMTATPVYDRAVSEASIRRGSDALLRAIVLNHPYIFARDEAA